MSDSVIDLDEHRPHSVVQCLDDHVHVVPMSLFSSFVDGNLPLDRIPACVIRRIVEEWATLVQGAKVR
jgi:hypothetical protein